MKWEKTGSGLHPLKQKEKESKMKKVKLFVVFSASLLLTGCTTNITSNGSNARFELSPARNIYPNTSVMNGLSLLPRSAETGDAGTMQTADSEQKSSDQK